MKTKTGKRHTDVLPVVPVATSVVPEQSPIPEAEPAGELTSYRLYLREVGQTPLLQPAEEVVLAKRIKRGDKKAREQMIKANLRLVVKIARDYEGYGVPLLDLISEGNIGLMKAVDRFDPNKGAKFSTYGSWWIKQAIRRALSNQSKTIRLPIHVVEKLGHMRKAENRLSEELGREPTDEELADELGMQAKRVKQYRSASQTNTSLDAPLGDEDSSRVADIIADDKAQTPYQELQSNTEVDLIRELIETLNDREATILRRRFGLNGEDKKTLEEIGADYGVTRERIRQIEGDALRKLRKQLNKLDKPLHFAA